MRVVSAASVITAFITVQSAAQTSPPPQPTATELAQALQRKYDDIRDFSADFVHRYRGGVLKREAVERGTLLVKKPGKMRWEYTAPEKKLFVSDGRTMYSYLPEDRQVLVSAVNSDELASTPALFLAGRGSLTRDFDVSFTEPPAYLGTASRALKLVPKTPQDEYEWLVLSVDPKSLALRGLLAMDTQGGTSSFVFTNLKENIATTDEKFVFTPPRGVEVIGESKPR
jgi:outer membrane lipoprotein carrier protein